MNEMDIDGNNLNESIYGQKHEKKRESKFVLRYIIHEFECN